MLKDKEGVLVMKLQLPVMFELKTVHGTEGNRSE
jgi:hypothetical protein